MGDPVGEQVLIPGGSFLMGDHFGDGDPGDGERPVHAVEVSPFRLDPTAVTVEQFSTFVDQTGYLTDAEDLGVSAVFHTAITAPASDIMHRLDAIPWWVAVRGADWRHPNGRAASAEPDHPVTQVTWNDAQAYAQWAGKRLPTEAEWEFAARGALEGQRFPWGNELRPDGEWRCNIFQGTFPHVNTVEDGYATTAPAKSFVPNAYGLWNMVGNVWEWCSDWFDPGYYRRSEGRDPAGPGRGDRKVFRGGSYLCHDSYCYRYRVAARSGNQPDATSANVGFRCASDVWGTLADQR